MTKKRSKSDNKNLPLNENEREELERLRKENETLKEGIAYQKKVTGLDWYIWKQQSEKIKVIKGYMKHIIYSLRFIFLSSVQSHGLSTE